jgi:hypothetical protein
MIQYAEDLSYQDIISNKSEHDDEYIPDQDSEEEKAPAPNKRLFTDYDKSTKVTLTYNQKAISRGRFICGCGQEFNVGGTYMNHIRKKHNSKPPEGSSHDRTLNPMTNTQDQARDFARGSEVRGTNTHNA